MLAKGGSVGSRERDDQLVRVEPSELRLVPLRCRRRHRFRVVPTAQLLALAGILAQSAILALLAAGAPASTTGRATFSLVSPIGGIGCFFDACGRERDGERVEARVAEMLRQRRRGGERLGERARAGRRWAEEDDRRFRRLRRGLYERRGQVVADDGDPSDDACRHRLAGEVGAAFAQDLRRGEREDELNARIWSGRRLERRVDWRV